MNLKKLFASIVLLAALALPALGQYDEAVSPSIDPSTGNVHISVPVFKRKWMSASIELNSHVYIGGQPGQFRWSGGYTNDLAGNIGNFPQAVSGIEYSVQAGQVNTGADPLYLEAGVVDPGGASHPLPSSFQWDYDGNTIPSTATTTDGSGYTVVPNGICCDPTKWTIYDRSGSAYTKTVDAASHTSWKKTDRDGNVWQRTYEGSGLTYWIDPTGTTFMSEQHDMESGNKPLDFYTYTDGLGNVQTISVHYQTLTTGTLIGCSGIAEETSQSVYMPSYISTAPNGQSTYYITWEPAAKETGGQIDGHLGSFNVPNGAGVSFAYSGGVGNVEESCAGVVPTMTETLIPGTGISNSTRTFVNNRGAATQSNFTVTETNSVDNSKVVQSYLSLCDINEPGSIGTTCDIWPFAGQFLTETQVFQGSTLLSTNIICYNGAGTSNPATCPSGVTPPRNPVTETDSYSTHDGMASTVTNHVLDYFDSFGLRTAHQIWDYSAGWGGATLLTTTNWGYDDSNSCGVNQSSSHIADRVCFTNTGYNGYTPYTRSSAYTYSSIGDLTQSSAQVNTTPTYIVTNYSGYAHGLVGSVATVGAGTTSYTYGACGGFGLTKVTAPVSTAGNVQYTWDCNGAVVTSVTGPNGASTTVSYKHQDYNYRLTEVDYPDSPNDKDMFGYSLPGTFPPSFETISALTSSTSSTSTEYTDGFGNLTKVSAADPNSPNGNATMNVTLNGLFQITDVTNPFFSTSDPTYGVTHYTYDALGRRKTVTNPDGGSYTHSYNGRGIAVQGLQSLNVVTQYDGAGRPIIYCDGINDTNAMANLDTTKNCGLADQTAIGFPTTFVYDPAGDLLSTTFGGAQTSESKSYQYDMMGRLTQQTLPESGVEKYTYDSPVVGQLRTYKDARGVITTYSVDNMYRATSMSFSDGTPTITNAYDLTSQTNGIGRLSTTSTANTITGFNYDVMGRMNLKGVQAPMLFGVGNTIISYTFDFAGNLTAMYDGASNNQLNYARNAIGQVTSVTPSYTGGTGSDVVPTSLESAFSYNALGLVTGYTEAAGSALSLSYDKMGHLYKFTGGAIYNFTLGRDADGKVTSVVDDELGSWTYGYDNYVAGGRLLNATCTANCANGYGTASWTYDEYGNRWTQSASKGLNTSFTFDTQHNGAMKNRIVGSGTAYDAAGDMLTDTVSNTYTYDAKHRIKTTSLNSSSFVFDGLGNRVEDVNGNGTFDFYFNGSSVLHFDTSATVKGLGMRTDIGEYSGAPGTMKFFEDFRDQVGSTRVQAKYQSGGTLAIVQSFVSLPFGDSYLDTNIGGDDSDITSKFLFGNMDQLAGENFSENRVNNIQTGRWLTPDPAHQGWNAYVYASNNPVTLNDPSGLNPDDDIALAAMDSFTFPEDASTLDAVLASGGGEAGDVTYAGESLSFFGSMQDAQGYMGDGGPLTTVPTSDGGAFTEAVTAVTGWIDAAGTAMGNGLALVIGAFVAGERTISEGPCPTPGVSCGVVTPYEGGPGTSLDKEAGWFDRMFNTADRTSILGGGVNPTASQLGSWESEGGALQAEPVGVRNTIDPDGAINPNMRPTDPVMDYNWQQAAAGKTARPAPPIVNQDGVVQYKTEGSTIKNNLVRFPKKGQ